MRIVHIEEFFHPDAGYQVNMLSRIQAREGHRVTVIAAELEKMPSHLTAFFGKDEIERKDAEFEQSTGVRIIRLPVLCYYSGRAIFKSGLFKTVSATQPDVAFIHAMETLTGILFVWFSHRLNYPLVLDSHMLEMATRNRFSGAFRAFFRTFVTPKILRENIPTIRVVDTDYLQRHMRIPLERTELLSFGTDTDHFRPDPPTRLKVRRQYGIHEDAFLVIYAGKLDEAKGGTFLAKAIQERFEPCRDNRQIEFLVIGNCDGQYGESVDRVLSASQNKLVRLPTQRYFDLAGFYQAADLAVYPRQCSLSFFDAHSCGLPVLFEENEINSQRASNSGAVTFSPGNVSDFRRRLMELAALPSADFELMRTNARNFVLKSYNYIPVAEHFNAVLKRAAINWRKHRQGGA